MPVHDTQRVVSRRRRRENRPAVSPAAGKTASLPPMDRPGAGGAATIRDIERVHLFGLLNSASQTSKFVRLLRANRMRRMRSGAAVHRTRERRLRGCAAANGASVENWQFWTSSEKYNDDRARHAVLRVRCCRTCRMTAAARRRRVSRRRAVGRCDLSVAARVRPVRTRVSLAPPCDRAAGSRQSTRADGLPSTACRARYRHRPNAPARDGVRSCAR